VEARILYAQIDIPTGVTEPCEVRCRICKTYLVIAPDLWAAQRFAWAHDREHWAGSISPPTPRLPKRGRT
jgi:hypothetical protein